MAITGSRERGSRQARPAWLAAASFASCLLLSSGARSERSTFRTYGADQGLTSPNGACLVHDGAGQVLVCTEHGVFTYDGRRFVNLGTENGLPQDGSVAGIALNPSGRMAIQYASEVYVSDGVTDAAHPATSLSFSVVDHAGTPFYDQRGRRLVPWQDGFAFLAGDATVGIVAPAGRPAGFVSMSYRPKERAILHGAIAVFSVAGRLWETFEDGRICAADPGAVRCYDARDGLTGGPWRDVIAGADGRVLARSASSVATLDHGSDRWSPVALPDQGSQYENYANYLGLYTTPDGRIITQAAQGLDILGPEGWRELTVADGAPDGIVSSAMTDATGQLWFHVLGRGLVRWVGYGHWETVEKSDGLSAGFPWGTARSADGHLWITTDGGVDEVAGQAPSLHVSRADPSGSYALASTPAGEIWTGYDVGGIRIVNSRTGSVSSVATPYVNTIVPGRGHAVWLGTEKGLYRVDDGGGPPFRPVFVGTQTTTIQSIVQDGGEGVYYLAGGRLRHRHPDGSDATVSGPGWPKDAEPLALAIARDGSLWVGGSHGLSHLVLSGDRIRSYAAIPVEDTGTTLIYAVMVDHRGWVWAGTALGISVYDGTRWVSANADQGLLSNDVNQSGIREDPDGSVWITTTGGVSHLKDPASLFVVRPLRVMVTAARLGERKVGAAVLPYTHDPLSIELGTPNYGVERSVLFRHRLSGVDAGWVVSSSGTVDYPFVPPGRHLFTVVAYDQLSHRPSEPATVVIDVAYPWWRRWWSEPIWAALAAAAIYGLVRIRYRAMYARQAELERHVAQATAQLRHQAAHDKLTGLLTRCEIETRLADRLADRGGGEELVVALLDVDHFKRINDRHGHLGGDEVLRGLGALIAGRMRPGEDAGRYGGEEILLVLADTDGSAAERVRRLHLSIRHDRFKVAEGPIAVTCSIGVAWVGGGDSWETVIGRADAALYKAKHAGRDRVVESRLHETKVASTG